MRLITVAGAAGGVGCTTIAAHMALLLQTWGHSCLALDLHARNGLGAHLGVPNMAAGWAQCVLDGDWWGQAAMASDAGMSLLPFGHTSVSGMEELQSLLAAKPDWLRDQLEMLGLAENVVVVADEGFPTSAWAWQALDCADAVLYACTPQADSLLSLAQMQEVPDTLGRFRVVCTRMDARRPSHGSNWEAMQKHWKEHLLTEVVHEDEAVPEAWMKSIGVQAHAPYSLAAHDLQGVAQNLHHWLSPQSEISVQDHPHAMD